MPPAKRGKGSPAKRKLSSLSSVSVARPTNTQVHQLTVPVSTYTELWEGPSENEFLLKCEHSAQVIRNQAC